MCIRDRSETAVAAMTDIFMLLQLPNAGDDLQAIKKGIVELADLIVINKADLDPEAAALARAQLKSALSMLRHTTPGWEPPVLVLSALKDDGVASFWAEVTRFRDVMSASGEFMAKRRGQALAWMWELIDRGLRARFRGNPQVRSTLPTLVEAVAMGNTMPTLAAQRLLGMFEGK